MKKKFYQTSEFNKLNKEWKSKLKPSGFEDIESKSNVSKNTIRRQEFTIRHDWIVYNQKCVAFLETNTITDALDLFIFQQHCEGVSNIRISRLLEVHGFKPRTSRAVDYRLSAILKVAGIEPVDFGSV